MLFYIYIFLGIALLSFGGDYLVKGSSSFAQKLKISPMIIGIVIIGFGTSVPEIFVASNAVINNAPDIALGSIIGSNIANILLVFSFALIIAKGPLLKIVSFGDMVIMFVITLLLVSILIIGSLKMPFSLLMVLLLLIYFYCSYRFFNTEMEIEEIVSNENLFKVFFKIIIGFILLFAGSELFINGLKDFANYYGIPEAVLGLSLAAIGTSLPELAVTFASVKNKAEKVLLGNIIGSNIINVLGALGISSIFGTIVISNNFSNISIYYLIFSAILLFFMTKVKIKQKYLGFSGLSLYVIYVFFLY